MLWLVDVRVIALLRLPTLTGHTQRIWHHGINKVSRPPNYGNVKKQVEMQQNVQPM